MGLLDEARRCFEAELYFEAHEVLEAAWLDATGERRKLLQGLIQAAAAWLHWRRGNRRGATSLSAAAAEKLSGSPDSWHGFPLGEYRDAICAWDDWLRAGPADGAAPPTASVGPRL